MVKVCAALRISVNGISKRSRRGVGRKARKVSKQLSIERARVNETICFNQFYLSFCFMNPTSALHETYKERE